ncbi:hypothetical protein L0Z14_19040 [Burkholderia multivorans]|nr:hypothetical protein [Burkholderia multivorans]MCL4663021.1 hypothetical protein [Burkholderia multivorans]
MSTDAGALFARDHERPAARLQPLQRFPHTGKQMAVRQPMFPIQRAICRRPLLVIALVRRVRVEDGHRFGHHHARFDDCLAPLHTWARHAVMIEGRIDAERDGIVRAA